MQHRNLCISISICAFSLSETTHRLVNTASQPLLVAEKLYSVHSFSITLASLIPTRPNQQRGSSTPSLRPTITSLPDRYCLYQRPALGIQSNISSRYRDQWCQQNQKEAGYDDNPDKCSPKSTNVQNSERTTRPQFISRPHPPGSRKATRLIRNT